MLVAVVEAVMSAEVVVGTVWHTDPAEDRNLHNTAIDANNEDLL